MATIDEAPGVEKMVADYKAAQNKPVGGKR